MSVIATDGVTIASDGRVMVGNDLIRDDAAKLHVRDGHIYGLVGSSAEGLREALIAWHQAGAKPDAVPKHGGWTLIVIEPSGQLTHYNSDVPYRCEMPYPMSYGSGESFAIAAMSAGAKPWQAVEITCRHSTTCGGVITEINIADAVLVPAAEAAKSAKQKKPKLEVV